MVEAGRIAGTREAEAHLRFRHRQARHHLRDGAGLGAVGLEELEARRRRGEQVAHLDARAGRLGVRAQRPPQSGVDGEHVTPRRPARAAGDGERRDRRDRGQRLAAEAQRMDRLEVAVRKLGGGVALDAEREVGGIHAHAVVDDADQTATAGLDRHVDARGAGVERVLDQLLHGGRRPLDNLASGDTVDQDGVEALDRHDYPKTSNGIVDAARRRGPVTVPNLSYIPSRPHKLASPCVTHHHPGGRPG